MGNEEDLEKMLKSLVETFKTIPDPRDDNKSCPLPSILALATAAMIAGARSLYAIFQWGRLQSAETVRILGFKKKKKDQEAKTPGVATLHRVFKRLDIVRFEAALREWSKQNLGDEEAIAIDGKALRGIHGEELPGIRLVTAYAPQAGQVLAQKGETVA